jgi:hypothetical protein
MRRWLFGIWNVGICLAFFGLGVEVHELRVHTEATEKMGLLALAGLESRVAVSELAELRAHLDRAFPAAVVPGREAAIVWAEPVMAPVVVMRDDVGVFLVNVGAVDLAGAVATIGGREVAVGHLRAGRRVRVPGSADMVGPVSVRVGLVWVARDS